MRTTDGAHAGRGRLGTLLIVLLLAGIPPQARPAGADHWAEDPDGRRPHWARTANPVRLTILDSVTAKWDGILAKVNADWNRSPVVDDRVVVRGARRSARKECSAVVGAVRVCNADYGETGWVGLTVRQYDAESEHLDSAVVKLNERWLRVARSNRQARRYLLCHELGHVLGLGHQNEALPGTNETGLGCMNDQVSSDEAGSNPVYAAPNQGDYDQLLVIYEHLDEATAVAQAATASPADGRAAGWSPPEPPGTGRGRPSVFRVDLGDGRVLVVDVFWADDWVGPGD